MSTLALCAWWSARNTLSVKKLFVRERLDPGAACVSPARRTAAQCRWSRPHKIPARCWSHRAGWIESNGAAGRCLFAHWRVGDFARGHLRPARGKPRQQNTFAHRDEMAGDYSPMNNHRAGTASAGRAERHLGGITGVDQRVHLFRRQRRMRGVLVIAIVNRVQAVRARIIVRRNSRVRNFAGRELRILPGDRLLDARQRRQFVAENLDQHRTGREIFEGDVKHGSEGRYAR